MKTAPTASYASNLEIKSHMVDKKSLHQQYTSKIFEISKILSPYRYQLNDGSEQLYSDLKLVDENSDENDVPNVEMKKLIKHKKVVKQLKKAELPLDEEKEVLIYKKEPKRSKPSQKVLESIAQR
jgi:hypothetical protein